MLVGGVQTIADNYGYVITGYVIGRDTLASRIDTVWCARGVFNEAVFSLRPPNPPLTSPHQRHEHHELPVVHVQGQRSWGDSTLA